MNGNINLLAKETMSPELQNIAEKVLAGERITDEEGCFFLKKAVLLLLGITGQSCKGKIAWR